MIEQILLRIKPLVIITSLKG